MKWHRPGMRDARELAARERRQQQRAQARAEGGVAVRELKAGQRFMLTALERDYATGVKVQPTHWDRGTHSHRTHPLDIMTYTGRQTNRGKHIYTHRPSWAWEDSEGWLDPERLVYPLPALLRREDPNYVRDEEEI